MIQRIFSITLIVTLLCTILPSEVFAENNISQDIIVSENISETVSEGITVNSNNERIQTDIESDIIIGDEITTNITDLANEDLSLEINPVVTVASYENYVSTAATYNSNSVYDSPASIDDQPIDGGLIGEGNEIDPSEVIQLMYTNAYATPDVSGMSQRDAIIAVALSQEGYTASGGTIYGEWFGLQDAWCAMFISWCAEKAGIPTSIIKKNAWAGRDPRGGAWSSCYYDGKYNNDFGVTMRLPSSGYIPKKGDIVWLDTDGVWSNGSDHVGLVTGTNENGSVIYTIEGNTTDKSYGSSLNGYKVMQKVRSVNKVHAYGVPNYSGAVAPYGYSISVSSNHITAGDKITLSYSAYDGVPCSAILYVYKNNSYYNEYQLGNYNGSNDSTVTIQMVEPGQFQFFLKVYNDAGYFQGSLTNGCLTMTVDEKPVDRKLIMDVWMSDTKMGSKPNEFLAGKQYYLCYKLFDSYSGQYLNEFSNYSYSVTETLYELDGSVAGSYTYQNSDNNWIAMTRDEKGTYRGKVTLSGDISAEYELSFDIIYKPTLSTPTNFVDLNLSTHKSTTLNVTVGGNLPGRYAVGASLNDDYAQLSWGSQSGMTFPLNITAKKAGTTSLSLMVYDIFDGKEEVVFTKIVSLTIKAPTYNVFFKALGASSVPDMQVKVLGSSLTLDDTIPAKTGYTFLGWSDVENATTAKYSPGGTYDLDKEVTLYAVWKANTYTVKYNGNGATSGSTASSTHTYDTSKALTANGFSKTGYTFLGWCTSSSATTATYSNQQSVKNLTSTNNDTVNLYAVWSKNETYTVSYSANSGSGAPASQTKTKDVTLTLSSTKPTRTGYVFNGWKCSYCGSVHQAGSSYTHNGSSTLTAQWTAITYTVKYNGNGSTSGSTASSTHTYDVSKILTANGFSRSGYTFLGWSTSSSATSATYSNQQSVKNLTSTNNGTVNLYAVWRDSDTPYIIDSGSISYYDEVTKWELDSSGVLTISGAGMPSSSSYDEWPWDAYKTQIIKVKLEEGIRTVGYRAFEDCSNLSEVVLCESLKTICDFAFYGTAVKNITIPQNVSKVSVSGNIGISGYGWSFGECSQLETVTILGNVTTIPTYTFCDCSSLKSLTLNSSVKYIDGSAFSGCNELTDVYYNGTIEEWNKISIDGGNAPLLNAIIHCTDGEIKKCTVTYNYSYNGGTSATKTTVSVTTGSQVDLTPTATKSGWTFVGWNTDPNATVGLSSYTITNDVTLYAIYKKTLTGSFYYGNNSLQTTQTVTIYNKATSGSITTPTLSSYSGWSAVGWRDDTTASSKEYSNSASVSISSDTKFYGIYSRSLTLSYNANGGSGAPSNQTVTQYYNAAGNTNSATLTLSSAVPTRGGYTFLGWSTSSSATTATYSSGSSYTSNNSTTLYAVWKTNTYTVKYNGNGATSGSTASSTHTYDVSKALTANGFSRTGYTFLGWSRSSSDTTAMYTNGQSVKNLTTENSGTVNLYAIWSKNETYTVSYNANSGSGTPSSQTKTKDVTLTLSSNKPTRAGYVFDGWKCNYCGGVHQAGSSYTHNSSATLTAQWTAITYTIKYDANGGSGAPSQQTKTYGVSLTISSIKPTKTGYTFLGWSTNSTATSANYSSNQSFSADLTTTDGATVTLYAVWKQNPPTTTAVESVSLNKSTATLNLNKTLTLVATVLPSNATNKNIVWTSSSESVATVSQNGVVTAKTTGIAIITVTAEDGGFTDTCKITVIAPVEEDSLVDCGTDANGINWYFYETGLLKISGNGAMQNHSSTTTIPWYSEKANITEVEISDGITHIGDRSFYNCISLEKVAVPNSVDSIGTYAFRNCSEMSIYAESGTYIQTYATENGIPFVNTRKEELKTITVDPYENASMWCFDISIEGYTEEATAYAAIYDEYGKLLAIAQEDFVINDVTTLIISKSGVAGASFAKIFVWENNLKPVALTQILDL